MKIRGEVVRKWECGACNELHDHEFQAENCCAPEITELWVCPICDEGHDKKADAESCCQDTDACVTCPQFLRDHDIGSLSYEAVKSPVTAQLAHRVSPLINSKRFRICTTSRQEARTLARLRQKHAPQFESPNGLWRRLGYAVERGRAAKERFADQTVQQ